MLDGVLDSAAGRFYLALRRDDNDLFMVSRPLRGRDSADLTGFIDTELARFGLSVDAVDRWTVGAGPGSFTGLRILAVLAAGWCFGKPEKSFRCAPGALGFASVIGVGEGETVGALYDGRNHELFFCGVTRVDGMLMPTGENLVLGREAAAEFLGSRPGMRLTVPAAEEAAVAALLPPGVEPFPVEYPDVFALARCKNIPYDNDPDRLLYFRAAVEKSGAGN